MVRLDCAERRILLDDGTFLPYDRLLLATGAYYLLPPVPGLKEAENVYGFRDLSDALAIDKAVKPGARAVIIGSGLVGMDAAYALMERGISPVIVEMADRILPLQLDAKAASEYQRLFEHHGCSFRLAARASRTRLDSRGNVSALVLEDGEELACDFIIAVRPEIRFLEHCSVETGRAVTVDQYLSTSVPGVYGAGDVCGLSGIWPNAMKQGAVAAKNMYGIPTPYEDTYAMKNTMNFFGLEIAMIGYQGTVFPVLLAVWFMSIVEKQLRRVIPDALDLILTPFLTVIISGFIALLIIGPAGRALGDGISFVLSTLITHAGWLAGLLFGGLYSVIVITGIHHSFHAIEAGLLGNPSIGVNFLLPIWAMANVAQGGACLAVWFKTKDAKIKAITLPSAFSAMLGITEAAIFGINLRFVKPFIAALIGGAVGGAWVVSMHVYMTAVGLTAIPGMAIVQASSLLNYIIGMVIAFGVAFVVSLVLKYKTDAE